VYTVQRGAGVGDRRLDPSISQLNSILGVTILLKQDRNRATAEANGTIHGRKLRKNAGNPEPAGKSAPPSWFHVNPGSGTDNVEKPLAFYNIGCHVSM
jgi:hypothetical protein